MKHILLQQFTDLSGFRMAGTAEFVDAALVDERRACLGLIAQSGLEAVEHAFAALAEVPSHSPVRAPETGLVMVRGRMGGEGGPFNVGEMTVTRAAVRLDSGEIGVGYVGGRSRRHAELAALADGMIQSTRWRAALKGAVLAPLEAARAARREARSRKAAATKVEFFTMVRTRGQQ